MGNKCICAIRYSIWNVINLNTCIAVTQVAIVKLFNSYDDRFFFNEIWFQIHRIWNSSFNEAFFGIRRKMASLASYNLVSRCLPLFCARCVDSFHQSWSFLIGFGSVKYTLYTNQCKFSRFQISFICKWWIVIFPSNKTHNERKQNHKQYYAPPEIIQS